MVSLAYSFDQKNKKLFCNDKVPGFEVERLSYLRIRGDWLGTHEVVQIIVLNIRLQEADNEK